MNDKPSSAGFASAGFGIVALLDALFGPGGVNIIAGFLAVLFGILGIISLTKNKPVKGGYIALIIGIVTGIIGLITGVTGLIRILSRT